jgi:apolipoprotein D and lipocalin family protein
MKKISIKSVSVISSLIGLFACSSQNYPPLDVVEKVDINRYIGKWYEIALLPNSFEKGCNCTTAEYQIIDSTTIRVINSCRKDSLNGKLDQANGKAFVVEGSNNSKLRVQFFWPFRGDYWIIDLDSENYQYAVVGAPSRKYLWILSRKPIMNDSLYNSLVEKCKTKGFNVNGLVKTNHSCSE